MSTTTTLDRVSATTSLEAPFEALRGHGFMQLTTFRKSGDAVATVVWFAEDGGRLYITTASNSGKVKRLRHTPRARVAPRSVAALRRKYGWVFWIFERCNRAEQTYLEVSPSPR